MLDAAIVGIYILTILIVGLFYSRNVTSMREFSLSTQRFPGPVILASISATYIGGEFIFGFAAQTFSVGLVFVFPLIGWCLCKIIIADAVVPRMLRFHQAISVGDIMEHDYGKLGRVVTGICGVVLCMGFVGAQISASGLLFHYFFDLHQIVGIIVATGIVVLYSSLGGFRAVAFTDLVQFAILIVAIPIMCNFELGKFGGLTALLDALPKSHVSVDVDKAFEQMAWFIIFLIPLLDPAVMQRILMDKDHKKVARSFRLSALIDIPIYIIVCLIGLIAFIKNPGLDPNLAFPQILHDLPVGIKGLAISGVLAVIMSTADSFLNAGSIALVHDVIKPCFYKDISPTKEMRITQLSTVILGTAAIIGALLFPKILDLIIYFQNISWVPLIMAPLYATIFGLGADVRAFVISGICGIAIQLIWPQIFSETPELLIALLSLSASTIGLMCGRIWWKGWPVYKAKDRQKNTRRLKLPSLSTIVTIFSRIARFSERRVHAFGAPYTLFGLFAVINYILPYFMWSSSPHEHFGMHLIMRFVAGMLCFALILHEYWPKSLIKYLPVYWHITLLYCLPFFATFMLLDNGPSNFWLCNIALALFLLASLVDWISFTFILVVGASLGIALFLNCGLRPHVSIDQDTVYTMIYMYMFAVLTGALFSRRTEKIAQEKLNTLRAFTALIAHELRTPLATISLNAQSMQRSFPNYVEGYAKAKACGLVVPPISAIEADLSDLPQRIHRVAQDTQNIIDMLLMKVHNKESIALETCSVHQCMEAALAQYPLTEAEKNKIVWAGGPDIPFLGNSEVFKHVLFNLLQNSLRAIASQEDGFITIWLEEKPTEYALYLKDNGPGVPKHILPHLFERFVSGHENGTGMGLAFCKMVMKGFGGDIQCVATEDKGALFMLTFPNRNDV